MKCRKGSRSLVLALLVLLPLFVVSPAAAETVYVYDDLGRLIAVIDQAGDTALYSYDVVGNLLSISRQASSQVSIIEFRPKRGPVGTPVTIFGTGFSTTPSQNSVTFNGTAATVTSSSATEIVVSVPAGATTGPIAVTAPSGSTTSGAPFTITAATDAPTITNFTPTIGTPGTAVTINGTNFETTPTHNKVGFNSTRPIYATVNSAAPTTLGVTVPPGATSGRIAVATPAGQATSSGDFFVPPGYPGYYTAADVVFTGRMVIGGSSFTGSFSVANKIGMVVFDGTIGQNVGLGVYPTTWGTVYVYRPDGVQLVYRVIVGVGGALYMATLPMTGTYTIVFVAQYAGNVTLTLSEEVTGTIAVGGPSVTVSVPRIGQRARITFSATAGQRVSVGGTAMTLSEGLHTSSLPTERR